MILNIPQQSPKRHIYIGITHLNLNTFQTEALIQLLPGNMFIFAPTLYLKLVRKKKSRASIFFPIIMSETKAEVAFHSGYNAKKDLGN